MSTSKPKFGDILHENVIPGSVPFRMPEGTDPGLLNPDTATSFLSNDVKSLLGIPINHKPHMALGTTLKAKYLRWGSRYSSTSELYGVIGFLGNEMGSSPSITTTEYTISVCYSR
jgi:hypothetical protein